MHKICIIIIKNEALTREEAPDLKEFFETAWRNVTLHIEKSGGKSKELFFTFYFNSLPGNPQEKMAHFRGPLLKLLSVKAVTPEIEDAIRKTVPKAAKIKKSKKGRSTVYSVHPTSLANWAEEIRTYLDEEKKKESQPAG